MMRTPIKAPTRSKGRGRRTAANPDPATALHRYAVSLFDTGDGRAVDWPRMAIALFQAALACADEALDEPRMQAVIRRVHDAAYTRMAGSVDSGTPFAPPEIEKPPLMPAMNLDHHLDLSQ